VQNSVQFLRFARPARVAANIPGSVTLAMSKTIAASGERSSVFGPFWECLPGPLVALKEIIAHDRRLGCALRSTPSLALLTSSGRGIASAHLR
jgi:hypothetical protein